jgi:5-formyltetrahydrofolate cyclo-ligase
MADAGARLDSKSALRVRMAAIRDGIPADQRQAKSEAIAQRLISWEVFAGARTVFAFVSIRSEVRTRPIIAAALAQGTVVGVPRTLLAQKRLEFRRVRDLTADLVPGPFGLAEPGPDAPLVEASAADLILVPGLAFDERGYRVGYGGGFYDRLLAVATGAVAAGLAFEEQLIERVPDWERDRPVGWVVTDKRLIACAADRR